MVGAGDGDQTAKFAFKRLFCQPGEGYSRDATGSTALEMDATVSPQIIACTFWGGMAAGPNARSNQSRRNAPCQCFWAAVD